MDLLIFILAIPLGLMLWALAILMCYFLIDVMRNGL